MKKTEKSQDAEEPITVGTYDVDNMSLSEKISAITAEIEAVAKKKRKNDTVNFAYRSVDDIQNAINPMLAQFKVTMQSQILKCDLTVREFMKGDKPKIAYTAHLHMRYIFSDKSKEQEIWEEAAMSEDYADKAVTQASSMCYKYAITRKFAIPVDDQSDGDSRQPDYRDTEHDEDRSGPRPTAWLNENTPEWEEAVTNPINAGVAPAKVLSDVKAKWRINKRQDAAILEMKPVSGASSSKASEQKPDKEQQPTNQEPAAAANPAASKPGAKTVLTVVEKTEWERLNAEYDSKQTPEKDRFKAGQVAQEMRLYNNNVNALKTRKVQLTSITSLYELDDTVLKHYTSL